MGFINPAIYAIGKGSHSVYINCFHDVTTGNTYNNHNPLRYAAVTGYDLCTGWGSPTGSNTINALAGVGTNDFTFYPSQGTFNLVAGGAGSGVITVAGLNGFNSNVSFSITNLPAGVTASVGPVATSTTATFSVYTTTNTAPGNYAAILTGTAGGLSHSVAINLNISRPIPGATPVSLASFFNRAGIYTDGRTFGGGLDNSGSAFSANSLGTSLSWNGLVFSLGPSNALDAIACSGQSIALPAGQFNTLQFLATGVNGNQISQTFTVTYTDNTTATFTQNVSDWANQQSNSGESTVSTTHYRNLSSGGAQELDVSIDAYSFTLDQTKTVKSIRLPSNGNVLIMSMVLANDDDNASLAGYYNRAGIYDDGVTFTNPATGGLDGGGAAYSGTLLGGSLVWMNTIFVFGPVNQTNVIAAAGQTITLPSGNYTALRMLATGVQGGQTAQSFLVTYTDNTSATFTQSLSDWFTPANYVGETKAVVMGHRNSSDGTKDNRTFYLYGYSFALNSAKTVKSIRLPNNQHVIVAAISLVPNWTPTFAANPFTLPAAAAGQNYSVNVATNLNDLNGGTLTCSKVSGPAWLNVAANGNVSGEPLSPDVGTNRFVLSVTDSGNLSSTATMTISVLPPPPIVPLMRSSGTNLLLNWSGGIPPYQVQVSTSLILSNWVDLGGITTSNNLLISPSNSAAFYRVRGQ